LSVFFGRFREKLKFGNKKTIKSFIPEIRERGKGRRNEKVPRIDRGWERC
jgi:hypothetical protein